MPDLPEASADQSPADQAQADQALPLYRRYDTALLDLDGVVYAGPNAIDHAVESLTRARSEGMRLAYVTNNASRTPDTVAKHLTDLGVPAGPSDVITSAQAAARLVADLVPSGSPVLVVGGDGLVEALRERGLKPVRSLDDSPSAVVQGFDPSVGWQQLAEASYAVAQGLPWVASNTDLTIPTARGTAPGNGTLVAVVRTATGVEPQVAGKPLPPMHRETIIRTGAKRPLVVGDRLDTDIEGASNGGVDSLLVFTGIAKPGDLPAAPPEHRPTYVAADLRGLLRVQPPLAAGDDGSQRCGGWTATVRDGVLEFGDERGEDPYDGLRALCAAVWAAADADRGGAPSWDKALSELDL